MPCGFAIDQRDHRGTGGAISGQERGVPRRPVARGRVPPRPARRAIQHRLDLGEQVIEGERLLHHRAPLLPQPRLVLLQEILVARADDDRYRPRHGVVAQVVQHITLRPPVFEANIEDHGLRLLLLNQCVRAAPLPPVERLIPFGGQEIGDHRDRCRIILNQRDDRMCHPQSLPLYNCMETILSPVSSLGMTGATAVTIENIFAFYVQ